MKRTRDWGEYPSITPTELAAIFGRTTCSDRGVVVLPRDGAALCASYPNCTCGEANQLSLDEFTRACLHCKQNVTLRFDVARGYFRGLCACGAMCTSDRPPLPEPAAQSPSPTSDSDAK